jgi:twitching motility protein PilT
MSALKSWLFHLARPEVTELALVSQRNPCARVEGEYEAIDSAVLSTDEILQILFNTGGSRHVDALGPKPTHWTARVEGVGPIAVAAVMLGEMVHARFSLRQRDTQAPAAPRRPSDVGEPPGPTGQRSSSLPGGSGPSAPVPSGMLDHDAGSSMSFELDFDDRKAPIQRPRIAAPAQATPLELRGATIGRVSPLLPGEPKHNPIGRVSPLLPNEPLMPPGTGRADLGARPGAAPSGGSSRPATPDGSARSLRTNPTAAVRPAAHSGGNHERLWKDLLLSARKALASDLHIIADRPPLLRVGGKLIPQDDPIDARLCEQMLLARVPVRLAPLLSREGSVDFALEEPWLGRFRVNVARQRTGLKASLRLIPAEIPTLASLGLPEAIGLASHHHQGLIVITGPTGHGKTTTLAAIVDLLNRERARHIITVEDPVEYVHPRKFAMVSQREVGTHTRSFKAALKAALREDPDVIVVGELRDTETVRMALSASETGHLVLGTMNTPSAAKTIDRLIDLFPPADQQQVRVTLAGGLRLIVSQRLVPSPDEMRMAAAAEVLPGSVPLWNLIRESKTYQIPSLQQRGRALGIVRLDDSLVDLVRGGKTTLPAALAVAEFPDEIEAALGRKPSVFPGDAGGRPSDLGLPPGGAPQDRPSAAPQQLSEPFGDSQPPPAPLSTRSRGFLERAGALFGKRGL